MNENYVRGKRYRYDFIKHRPGMFHKYYFCSYCGKIISVKKMTVDHLIPVHKVKRFGLARILLWVHGIHNVNDTKNLVPSCQRCNSRKSDKMGLWILRGSIGKHTWFWFLLNIAVLALVVYFVIEYRADIRLAIKDGIQWLSALFDKS